MRKLLLVLNTLAIFIAIGSASKVRYDNFKVFKIRTKAVEQQNVIEKLAANSSSFSLWRTGDKEIDVMVTPENIIKLKNFTTYYNLPLELKISNVQSLIDAEISVKSTDDLDSFSWTKYHSLSDIEAFLDAIFEEYARVASVIDIGTSYEGRKIRGIKISYKEGNPGIFIESNINACEWITSATATWLINELLSSTDIGVRTLAENYDWYIVPVLNVDGFTYSHETNRLWRKTRQPSEGSNCIGTDPNRNFDSHWLENDGASSDPCSEAYGGSQPFSEPEIKAFAEYVTSIKDRINILLSFHSYSQLVLAPYGWTSELPDNYDDLIAIATAYTEAVKSLPYGTVYTSGSSSNSLYFVSGGTKDWAYDELGISITYTIEFRDTGRYGFVLPPTQIIPNCQETLAGIIALVDKADELGYLEVKYT